MYNGFLRAVTHPLWGLGLRVRDTLICDITVSSLGALVEIAVGPPYQTPWSASVCGDLRAESNEYGAPVWRGISVP